LLDTVPAGVNDYQDSGLTEVTTYWYKVRAIRPDGPLHVPSNFSEEGDAITEFAPEVSPAADVAGARGAARPAHPPRPPHPGPPRGLPQGSARAEPRSRQPGRQAFVSRDAERAEHARLPQYHGGRDRQRHPEGDLGLGQEPRGGGQGRRLERHSAAHP